MSQPGIPERSGAHVRTGADVLVASGFATLKGRRVGLITNHTGRVGNERLIDVLARAPDVRLTAILSPEHGLGGAVEAGAKVQNGTDEATGLPIHSLYGGTAKPTPEMLANFDVLVFDMQDIGVRYYTYISTMGLCMQAAAAAKLPFVVLDRPNPLGGEYVAGFAREKGLASFVGLYPIPQVHGMTVGELARMIKGAGYLRGLGSLDLKIEQMEGWRRDMLWPDTGLVWVPPSPNIPTFETALVYAGTGLFEQTAASEGRGTRQPFLLIGHSALDARRAVRDLEPLQLPGVKFEVARFTPRPIAGVATRPRFSGTEIPGIRIIVTDARAYRPLETALHLMAIFDAQIRAAGSIGIVEKPEEFARIAGTPRLLEMLDQGAPAAKLIAGFAADTAEFKRRRAKHLLY